MDSWKDFCHSDLVFDFDIFFCLSKVAGRPGLGLQRTIHIYSTLHLGALQWRLYPELFLVFLMLMLLGLGLGLEVYFAIRGGGRQYVRGFFSLQEGVFVLRCLGGGRG